jgi:hypothetical protein
VARGRAQLAAGLGLGITAGSIFETPAGARLVVESVGQRSTTARVATGSVREGDRALLRAHRYETSPLLASVAALDTRLVAELRARLGDASGVELVERGDAFAHLIVRRGGNELRVVGSDGFHRHTGIPADPSGIERLAAALRKEAASKRLGDMDNPAPSFGVRLELLGRKTSFGIGEEIAFSVESERDGYLTLVDLGTDGTVAMLLPNAEMRTVRLRAGERFTYPEPGSSLTLRALEPAGTGLVRAFVTAAPLAIDVPAGQEYAHGGEAFAARVAAALVAAAGQVDGAVRLDSWGTAAIVYEIHE